MKLNPIILVAAIVLLVVAVLLVALGDKDQAGLALVAGIALLVPSTQAAD